MNAFALFSLSRKRWRSVRVECLCYPVHFGHSDVAASLLQQTNWKTFSSDEPFCYCELANSDKKPNLYDVFIEFHSIQFNPIWLVRSKTTLLSSQSNIEHTHANNPLKEFIRMTILGFWSDLLTHFCYILIEFPYCFLLNCLQNVHFYFCFFFSQTQLVCKITHLFRHNIDSEWKNCHFAYKMLWSLSQ